MAKKSMMARSDRPLTGWLKRFASDRRGSLSLIIGMMLPVAVGAAAAAVDYSRLSMAQGQMQTAADETALAGARELQLRQVDVGATRNLLETIALQRLNKLPVKPSISVAINLEERTVEVGIAADMPVLLLNHVSAKSSAIGAKARARALGGQNPLCLVSLDENANDGLNFGARTRMEARGCTLHGNSVHPEGFAIDQRAEVNAAVLCAAGRVSVNPYATANAQIRNDCPEMRDPLGQRELPVPGACLMNGAKISGATTLVPGTYCGDIRIQPGAVVTLQSGTYVFHKAIVQIEAGARVVGTHVNLHFSGDGPKGKTALIADKDSIIDLTAPRSGTMAGLLLTTERGLTDARQFHLSSENARRLLGTIYLPSGDIWLGNGKPIADQSAFTIIVARKIATRAGPSLTNDTQLTLVLNTNYHLTDVPVPTGLGNNTGAIQLVK